MQNPSIHQLSLLQKLLLAGGFIAAAGFNPNLVYAQAGSSVAANTLPTGGSVAQGNATIGAAAVAANGRNTLAISQTSTAAVLNWSTFNVGSNSTVSFQQPSNGVTLNRVNSNQGSEIYGQITATGSVFLVNPAGILFAPGAQVNVGGLVASTLDITDNNFILGSQSGDYQFNSTQANIYAGQIPNSLIKAGQVINQGSITANGNSGAGGTVALLGQTIRNEGIIAARLGTVALAAGQDISLQFQGSRLIKVQISQAEFDTLIDNKGIIKAEGGWVLMNAQTAAGLARAVVNHSGVIEAQTVADLQGNAKEGKVEILADFNNGTVNTSGSVDISAPTTGALSANASMPCLPAAKPASGSSTRTISPSPPAAAT
jgi:filamentous hemagglutinin family protein